MGRSASLPQPQPSAPRRSRRFQLSFRRPANHLRNPPGFTAPLRLYAGIERWPTRSAFWFWARSDRRTAGPWLGWPPFRAASHAWGALQEGAGLSVHRWTKHRSSGRSRPARSTVIGLRFTLFRPVIPRGRSCTPAVRGKPRAAGPEHLQRRDISPRRRSVSKRPHRSQGLTVPPLRTSSTDTSSSLAGNPSARRIPGAGGCVRRRGSGRRRHGPWRR